ncbi:MAG: sodium:proton antiporter [Pseudomonadales bacterium]|nr:sodium:proton antiporter [Pseudomonadales bacterium]
MGCQWLAWRVQLPAIVFLLLTGIVMGPVTGVLQPDVLFGQLLMPFVSLSVAIILFEGSLTLRFEEIRELGTVIRRIVSIGAIVVWVLIALATRYIMGFSWEVSALLGALLVVTGPTVIVPMLRSVRPKRNVANILRWEGIVIDPIGALFAVVCYEFILASSEYQAIEHTLVVFTQTVIAGSILGALAGYLLGIILRKQWLPEYLHSLIALSMVLMTFSLSNTIMHESGLLAVTVMGMWLSNMKDVHISHILNFKEDLTILLISVLFIVLAARIDFSLLFELGWKVILMLLVIQLLVRPIQVVVSTLFTDLTWKERAFLSWIAPRGIVAAAVSAIFAEKLQSQGYNEAVYLVPLTFFVIMGTVLLQSATARLIARMLDVREPEPTGFLIVGANRAARKIASELVKQGFRCVLTDSNWDNIRHARMDGLDTYYGNPVSEDADRYLDLTAIGNLMTLSPQRDANIVIAIHYRAFFGRQNIFTLFTSSYTNKSEKHSVSASYRGLILFGEELTFARLSELVATGYEMRTTTLSNEFTWSDYLEKHGDNVIPLFYIRKKGGVRPFCMQIDEKPEPGWKIMSLIAPSDLSESRALIPEAD